MKLQIEINSHSVKEDTNFGNDKTLVMINPAINEDFWLMRVPVSKKQAVVCFPKFFTIGCGFQVEDNDWNTNLPISCPTSEIFDHIKCNKGDNTIMDEDCRKAIDMLRQKAFEIGAISSPVPS